VLNGRRQYLLDAPLRDAVSFCAARLKLRAGGHHDGGRREEDPVTKADEVFRQPDTGGGSACTADVSEALIGARPILGTE